MTARAKGLRQIENAQWMQGEYGCLSLHVHTPRAMPSMGIDPYDKKRGFQVETIKATRNASLSNWFRGFRVSGANHGGT